MRWRPLLCLSFFGLFGLSPNPSPAQNILVLGETGDRAPDGDGFMYGPSIFALTEGAAAYSTVTYGNSLGSLNDSILVTASWRGIETVFREGDAAPSNGTFSGTLGQISVNSLGRVAYYGILNNTSLGNQNDEGIYSGSGLGITQIVRENQAAPAGGAGVFNSFGVPTINLTGQVAFWGAIRGAGTPLIDSHGIFVGSGGAVTQIARTYTAAPGGNGEFSSISSTPKISNTGWVAFRADLRNTVGGALDNSGIFMGNGVSTVTIARENTLAPDGNGRFDSINFSSMNDNNKVAFYTTLRDTSGGSSDNIGIFSGSGGSLAKIARLGDAAPGGGTYTGLSNSLSINTLGDVAFTGSTSAGDGVFWSNGVQSKSIARTGQTAPQGGIFTGFTLASINNTRTVAFQANLNLGAGSTGIYLGDGVETLMIARVGDTLSGSKIQSLGFDPSTFNDFRQLAFQAILENGTWGAYVFSPEIKWRQNGNGLWSDDTRWTVSLRPGEYTQVEIDPAAGGIITGPTADTSIRSLRLGGTTTGTAELNLQQTANLTILEGANIAGGGKLTGKGRIIGDVTNDGIVAPGNSPGDIEVEGNYTQSADGSLVLQIGGLESTLIDHLNATGQIVLGGTLELQLIDGFTPLAGMTFDLSTGQSISFNDLDFVLPTLANGLSFAPTIIDGPTSDTFRVTVVPEPSLGAMVLLGSVALAGRFRRRSARR